MITVIGWDAFTLSSLCLAWTHIWLADARSSVRPAALQDFGRTAIFLFVVLSSVASLSAVGIFLGHAKALPRQQMAPQVLLAGATVVLSWFLIHTVFALHYAHLFYRGTKSARASERVSGSGLEFPGNDLPDLLDFAYFSFVIGMTCQVSDVTISSRAIRRVALFHGLLTFGFNVIILALTINLTSGLL